MGRIMRNGGISIYMGVLGGTTVLTGLYLLWRFTGGFDPAVAASHAGLAFSIGGAAGILAGIVGGGVVGRSSHKVSSLLGQAVEMSDAPARGALTQQAASLRGRMRTGSRVVIALQTIALICMAVGHYV
jgi:alanine dehydrogenase